MNKAVTNYDKLMQKTIEELAKGKEIPTVFLHSCCAPCSSSVIKKLSQVFKITVFYYNPNIDTLDEYNKRAEEQKTLIQIYNEEERSVNKISLLEADYNSEDFRTISAGLEDCREGGARCMECYKLRLKKTSEEGAKRNFNFFCSTLSVSPLKNAAKINEIGNSFSSENCKWLFSDFKKRNGYLDSIRLSRELGLYRQDYCGCVFSRRRLTERTNENAKL